MKKALLYLVIILGIIVGVSQLDVIKELRKSADGSQKSIYFTDAVGSAITSLEMNVGQEKDLFVTVNSLDTKMSAGYFKVKYDPAKVQVVSFDSSLSGFKNEITKSNVAGSFSLSLGNNQIPEPVGVVVVAQIKIKVLGLPAGLSFEPNLEFIEGDNRTLMSLVRQGLDIVAPTGGGGSVSDFAVSFSSPQMAAVGNGVANGVLKMNVGSAKLGSFGFWVEVVGDGIFASDMGGNTTGNYFSTSLPFNATMAQDAGGKKIYISGQVKAGTSYANLPGDDFEWIKFKLTGVNASVLPKLRISQASASSVYVGSMSTTNRVAVSTPEIQLTAGSGSASECSGTEKRCENTSQYRSCQNGSWGPAVGCGSGNKCETGTCVPVAVSCRAQDCNAPANATAKCTNNSCDFDCNSGYTKSGGSCTANTVVVCSGNESICVGTSQRKTCRADGTWGPAVGCGSGNNCETGTCVPISSAECSGSERRCSDSSAYQACQSGQWGSAVSCASGKRCDSGSCISIDTPPVVGSDPYKIKFKVAFGGLSEGSDSGQCGPIEPVGVKVLSPDAPNGELPEVKVNLTRSGSVCRVADSNGNCELALQVYEGELDLAGAPKKYASASLLVRGGRHLQMKYGRDGQVDYFNKSNGEMLLENGKTFNFSGYPLLPGDVNEDQIVDGQDYGLVVDLFGYTDVGAPDLDYSCQINAQDLNLLKITLNEKQSQLY